MCSGGTDRNGCMMPDSCAPIMVKLYIIACLLFQLNLFVQKTWLLHFPVLMFKIVIRLVSVINIVLQLVEKMRRFALLMTQPLLVHIQIPACLPLMKVSLYKKKFLLKFFLKSLLNSNVWIFVVFISFTFDKILTYLGHISLNIFFGNLRYLKYYKIYLPNYIYIQNWIRIEWNPMYYKLSCNMWSRGTDL